MNLKPIFLLLVLSSGLFGCSTSIEQPHQYIFRSANASELPEVSWYEKPAPETLQNLKVTRISLTKGDQNRLAALPKDPKNGPKWLVEEDPDTLHVGPWKTEMYILENTDTNHCVRIEVKNHVSGGVRHIWLNEKILFVEVWWGHAGCTDFILDTETAKFLYIEDGFDYSLPDE